MRSTTRDSENSDAAVMAAVRERVVPAMEAGGPIEASRRDLGFAPRTTIDEGLPRFVEWYRAYHRV